MIRPPDRRGLLLGAGAALVVPLRAAAQQSVFGYQALRDAALSRPPSAQNRLPNMEVDQRGWTVGSTSLSEVAVELPNPRLTPGPGVIFDTAAMSDLRGAIVLTETDLILRINVPRFVMGRDIRTVFDEERLGVEFRVRGQFVATGTFEDSTPVRIRGTITDRNDTLRRLRTGGTWSFTCTLGGLRAYVIDGSLTGSADALRLAEDELRVRRAASRRGYTAEGTPVSGGMGCPFTSVAALKGWADDGPGLGALRHARDRRLLPFPAGARLVRQYYASAPLFAAMATRHGPGWAQPQVETILAALRRDDIASGMALCARMIALAKAVAHAGP